MLYFSVPCDAARAKDFGRIITALGEDSVRYLLFDLSINKSRGMLHLGSSLSSVQAGRRAGSNFAGFWLWLTLQ